MLVRIENLAAVYGIPYGLIGLVWKSPCCKPCFSQNSVKTLAYACSRKHCKILCFSQLRHGFRHCLGIANHGKAGKAKGHISLNKLGSFFCCHNLFSIFFIKSSHDLPPAYALINELLKSHHGNTMHIILAARTTHTRAKG